MKNNTEIRQESWQLLIKGQWVWKLLGASILLSMAARFIYSVVDLLMGSLSCLTINKMWSSFLETGVMPEFSWPDILPSVFLMVFLTVILNGISAYGNNLLLNRSVDNNEPGFLKAAFEGFKMPLELGWLYFRLYLAYLVWFILASLLVSPLVLGVIKLGEALGEGNYLVAALVCIMLIALIYITIFLIPFYKYRFLFRIKADHPDWSASECMKYCRELTNGNKMRSFKLDCAYWRIMTWLLLSALPILVLGLMIEFVLDKSSAYGTSIAALGVLLVIVLLFVTMSLSILASFYIGVGQTILYKELDEELRNSAHK